MSTNMFNLKIQLIMAATKFSVITTGENPTWHICVKELPGEHTYKVAVTVAKALMQEVKGEKIVAVVESWKLYPNETKKKTNITNLDSKE